MSFWIQGAIQTDGYNVHRSSWLLIKFILHQPNFWLRTWSPLWHHKGWHQMSQLRYWYLQMLCPPGRVSLGRLWQDFTVLCIQFGQGNIFELHQWITTHGYILILRRCAESVLAFVAHREHSVTVMYTLKSCIEAENAFLYIYNWKENGQAWPITEILWKRHREQDFLV